MAYSIKDLYPTSLVLFRFDDTCFSLQAHLKQDKQDEVADKDYGCITIFDIGVT